MATIVALRKTVGDEPGTDLVDCDINKPRTERGFKRVCLFLERTSVKTYKVVGGCRNGLDLFSVTDVVEIGGTEDRPFLMAAD